jgi:signal peptidase I
MANAAPYIAQPLRRLVAGVLDLVVLLFFVIRTFLIQAFTIPSM